MSCAGTCACTPSAIYAHSKPYAVTHRYMRTPPAPASTCRVPLRCLRWSILTRVNRTHPLRLFPTARKAVWHPSRQQRPAAFEPNPSHTPPYSVPAVYLHSLSLGDNTGRCRTKLSLRLPAFSCAWPPQPPSRMQVHYGVISALPALPGLLCPDLPFCSARSASLPVPAHYRVHSWSIPGEDNTRRD